MPQKAFSRSEIEQMADKVSLAFLSLVGFSLECLYGEDLWIARMVVDRTIYKLCIFDIAICFYDCNSINKINTKKSKF